MSSKTGKTKKKITADLVLSYYDKSKQSKSKSDKDYYLNTAKVLSQHLNEWLVVSDD
jgi:hypothetical protein